MNIAFQNLLYLCVVCKVKHSLICAQVKEKGIIIQKTIPEHWHGCYNNQHETSKYVTFHLLTEPIFTIFVLDVGASTLL